MVIGVPDREAVWCTRGRCSDALPGRVHPKGAPNYGENFQGSGTRPELSEVSLDQFKTEGVDMKAILLIEEPRVFVRNTLTPCKKKRLSQVIVEKNGTSRR